MTNESSEINKSLDIIERWQRKFTELKEKIWKECQQINPDDFIDFNELEREYSEFIACIEKLEKGLIHLNSLGKNALFRDGTVGLDLEARKQINTPPQKRGVLGYYPNSLERIREIIKANFPNAEPKEGLNNLPSHLLWMLEEIEKLKTPSPEAARWLGYVLGRIEALGFITNEESREIVRKDVSEGYE